MQTYFNHCLPHQKVIFTKKKKFPKLVGTHREFSVGNQIPIDIPTRDRVPEKWLKTRIGKFLSGILGTSLKQVPIPSREWQP